MIKSICLDNLHSTTQPYSKEKPVFLKNADDKFETTLFLAENLKRKGAGGLRTQGYFKKSYEDKLLVSIITVVFNGDKFLEKTIKSIINQKYDSIEYIIIDGGSTDSTLDIIKKYEEQIDYWVSEPDNGIYDAMNKGLTLATGEYIGILNADDYYKPNAIQVSIEKIIETGSDYSIACAAFVGSSSTIRPIYPLKENYHYQEMFYPHVSAFISSRVYKSVGLFDTAFKIAGDHDMALRIHLRGYKACYIDHVIASLEEGGISDCVESNKESLHVSIKNGKNYFFSYTTYFNQLLKASIARLLSKKSLEIIQKIKGSRFQ